MAEGTASSDAITKNQLDTALGNKHGNNQNIYLRDTYVINSKQQTFNEMNANRNSLVCFEDVRVVFVSRKESVFPMQTHLDMGTNYINNVKTPINNDQGINKSYTDTKLSLTGGLMTGNLDMNNKRIYNEAQTNSDNQPPTKIWSENKFLDKSSGVMAGPLNMSNNRITRLANPAAEGDAINKSYVDTNFLKLFGATVTGHIIIANHVLALQDQAISRNTGNASFVQIINPYVYTRFNTSNNKIINLGHPKDATDGFNLRTLNKHNIKPPDHTNRFAYLMGRKNALLQWTDLPTNSIALNSIGDLETTSGNYDTYNKKVINASIRKNSEGGYKWKLAIQCYPLQKDKEYTLCLEILTTDYQLWHKSVITVDTTTSQGITVKRWYVNKYSHEYKTSSNQTEFKYYRKVVVVFRKTASSTPYFLDVGNIMAQAGSDLGVYPTNFNRYYLIAYGILGETMDLDPNKTYDYHTGFDTQPTRVVYNVGLDMNQKKILNIVPDKSRNNSAATVKMVKDLGTELGPYTKNNVYREIFQEFYDFSMLVTIKCQQEHQVSYLQV